MARKRQRISRGMLFTWLMLGGLIFLFAPQSLTNRLQFAFTKVFRLPISAGRSISLAAKTQQQPPAADTVSSSEYQKLQNYLVTVTAQRDEEHKKVEKLSRLREIPSWERMKFRCADVITVSMDNRHSELIINRGKDDGIAKGQYVLGDNSIIGVVSSVDSTRARVKLITDITSKIAVQIGSFQGLLQGKGSDLAKINIRPGKGAVKAGEPVKAVARKGVLDAQMIVGSVTGSGKDEENPLLLDVKVKPACDIKQLKDVVVLISDETK